MAEKGLATRRAMPLSPGPIRHDTRQSRSRRLIRRFKGGGIRALTFCSALLIAAKLMRFPLDMRRAAPYT